MNALSSSLLYCAPSHRSTINIPACRFGIRTKCALRTTHYRQYAHTTGTWQYARMYSELVGKLISVAPKRRPHKDFSLLKRPRDRRRPPPLPASISDPARQRGRGGGQTEGSRRFIYLPGLPDHPTYVATHCFALLHFHRAISRRHLFSFTALSFPLRFLIPLPPPPLLCRGYQSHPSVRMYLCTSSTGP